MRAWGAAVLRPYEMGDVAGGSRRGELADMGRSVLRPYRWHAGLGNGGDWAHQRGEIPMLRWGSALGIVLDPELPSLMANTMKALRKVQAARGLSLEKTVVPAIGPTDVLVRVRTASICGTDLHIYGWDRWSQGRIKPPVTLGHEFCGVVENVGDEVTAVKAGDFVSAEMHVNCGHCRQCRIGEAHVCQNLKIIGIDQDGAFA
ncbi:MAG TPA: alcohol dehydrogenase catalytic domain-containing protein, partial [Bryobacteraceae bacterium]|nr:alcohol dehydrogenase catalytic domain-containing protein [Bryobacteraceae bacterium]